MSRPTSELKLAELQRRLKRRGIDPEEHEELLLIYCEAYSSWTEAVARIEGMKFLTKSPRDGVVVSPWVEVRDNAVATMDRIGRQLGLSPDHAVAPTLPNWFEWASALHD